LREEQKKKLGGQKGKESRKKEEKIDWGIRRTGSTLRKWTRDAMKGEKQGERKTWSILEAQRGGKEKGGGHPGLISR